MIQLGITRLLREKREWLEGRSVGLLTNQTGVDENLRSNITLLGENVNLVGLFSPEHGVWGAVQDGVRIPDSELQSFGTEQRLPVHSLYRASPLDWTVLFKNLEVLIYDLQDVGTRYYTYLGVLLRMMAALESDGTVVCIVADRPNPLGGICIEGPMLDMDYASLVGPYPLPVRYGMTLGEVAKLYHSEQGFQFRLKVASMEGWDREMWYDDTGLQWVPPSPNMPSFETALLYPGTCLFEGTNMSEGRGTTKPFEYIGAPWIDKNMWAGRLNAQQLPGVLFRPVTFLPQFSKYQAEVCHGVAIHITDKTEVSPVDMAVRMLATLIEAYPHEFEWRESHFDRLVGSSVLREGLLAGASCGNMMERWFILSDQFRVRREPYLLY